MPPGCTIRKRDFAYAYAHIYVGCLRVASGYDQTGWSERRIAGRRCNGFVGLNSYSFQS